MPNNPYDELLTEAPGAPAAGGYDAVLNEERGALRSRLQQNFSVGAGVAPDARAKALQLGQQTGLPTGVVERNLPAVEKQTQQFNDYDGLIRDSPRTADWLAASPDNVAVSHDDLDNLRGHEKAIKERGFARTFWDSLNAGSAHLGSSLARIPAAGLNTLNAGFYGGLNLLLPESMEVRIPQYGTSNPVSRYYDAQTDLWNKDAIDADMMDAYEMVKRGDIASAAKVAVQQFNTSALPSLLVAGASTAAGAPGVGLGVMGATSGADAYQEAEKAGVSPGQAASHAVTSGSLEVLTERLSFGTMGWMKNVVDSVASRFGKQAAVQFAKDSALEITKAMGGEAVEEMAAEAGQAASEYLNGVNPEAFDEFGRRMFNAGVLGALGGGVGGVATTGAAGTAQLLEHNQKKAQAKADKQLYLELGKLAEGSKVRQRGTDLHQQALRALAGDSEVKDVYVPVEMFQNAPWQDTSAADMAARMGVTQGFNEAVETGGDVKVPLEVWVDKVVGTPAYAALASDIKFTPDGLTLNEVGQQEATLQAQFEAAATEAKEAPGEAGQAAQAEQPAADPMASIREDFQAQVLSLKDTPGGKNFITDDYAKGLTEAYVKGLQTFAKDAGVDPMSIHQRINIGRTAEGGGQALAQEAEKGVENFSTSGNIDSRPLSSPQELDGIRAELARVRAELVEEKQLRRTSAKTGLPNELAFDEENAKQPFDQVWAMDFSNFKAYNNLLTHEGVDKEVFPEVGVALLEAAKDLGMNIYHRSGDEFQGGTRGMSEEETAALMKRLVDRLRYVGIELNGVDVEGKPAQWGILGVPAVFGIGKGYKDADLKSKLEADRRRKLAPGEEGHLEDLRKQGGVPSNFVRLDTPEGRRAFEVYRESLQHPGRDTGTALEQSGVDQTQTSEFKAWSGGSPLVSREKASKYKFKTGKPVTVEAFHGTPEGGFESFDPYKVGTNTSTPADGFYFTESDKNAATYSGARPETRIKPDQAAFDEGETQRGSYHAYVTFKNPLVVDFDGRNWDGSDAEGNYDFDGINDWVNRAVQDGHDGLIAKNVSDEGRYGQGYNWGELTYVAFSPTQIKSAIGNRGTFDPSDPNILKQEPGSGDSPRGRITFMGQEMNVEVLENADFTTLVHEVLGHAFLQVQTELAMAPDATPAMQARQQATLEYLGLESSDQLIIRDKPEGSPERARAVAAHEKFAQGFEVYLYEGKAPTPSLRKVFASFRLWITAALKKLAGYGIKLSPQARAVYDRFLATEEEVRAAMPAELPLESGMDSQKAQEYLQAVADAREQAEEQVLAELMKDITKKQKAEYKARESEVQAQVEKDIDARKEYQTVARIQAQPELRLDRKQIGDARLGRDLAVNGGLNPDIAAEMLGYPDGPSLVTALSGLPARDRAVTAETKARMEQQFPDLLTSPELSAEARKAVHNDARRRLLRLQLENLPQPALKEGVRRLTRRLPTDQQVRQYAEQTVGRSKVSELKPFRYEQAERRMARLAGEAFAKGDFEAVRDYKLKELYNHELYRAARRAQENVEKAQDLFGKFSRPDAKLAASKRDMDVVNAGRAVLASFGLGKSDKPAATYLDAMRKYETDKDVVESVEALLSAVTEAGGQPQDYRQMSYDQFTALADSIEALWNLSKSQRQVEISGQIHDREEFIDSLNERLDELAKQGKKPDVAMTVSEAEKSSRNLQTLKSYLRRVESWADLIDGGKGPFSAMVRQLKDKATEYRAAKKTFIEKYLELAKQVAPTLTHDVIQAPELTSEDHPQGFAFRGKAELLGALLHTGNESNLSKLVRGYGWGERDENGVLDRRKWDAFVSRAMRDGIITKQDMDFVQGVWDLLEETKPDAQRAHKQMYGYHFNEVTANPVETPWGTYRGGYMPAVADRLQVEDAAIRAEKEAIEKNNNSFMFPTTGRGFTKSRVEGYAAPLDINLRTVPAHLDKVLRFTHIEPTVKQLGRIVGDKRFRAHLKEYDASAGQHMLAPWLQRAAQQNVSLKSDDWTGWNLWRTLRTRSGLNVMTANVLNTLQQFTGFSMSAVKVAPKHMRNALWDYIRHPQDTAEWVSEKSKFMANRTTAQVMEVQSTIDDLLLNPSKYEKAQAFAKKHGYFMQSATQNVVDVVTWKGAYNEALEQGRTDAEAVKDADAAVRLTQGSFDPEDMTRFAAGSNFARLFTMFQDYFNMQANLLGTEFARTARDMGLKKGAGRALYIYTLGFLIPVMLSEAITKAGGAGFDEDDDDEYLDDFMAMFFGSQARTLGAMVPFAGPTLTAGVNFFNDKPYDDRISTSPAISQVEGAVRAPHSVYKAIADDGSAKKAIRDTLTLLGLLTGVPFGAAGRPAGYLADVAQGRSNPEGPVDVVQGVLSGRDGTNR